MSQEVPVLLGKERGQGFVLVCGGWLVGGGEVRVKKRGEILKSEVMRLVLVLRVLCRV